MRYTNYVLLLLLTTYQSAGYAKPNRSSNKSTHLTWWTENSASKPLFSVLVDG